GWPLARPVLQVPLERGPPRLRQRAALQERAMHREPMARLLRAEAKTPLVTGQVADQAVAPRERELMTAAPVRGMTVATGSCVPKVFAPAEPVKQPAV